MKSLESYEQDLGIIRVQALTQGGEELLDRVEAKLGIASRHIARVQSGLLGLVPMVTKEIDASIADARELLGVGPAKHFGRMEP
jgi:hypothetical protein